MSIRRVPWDSAAFWAFAERVSREVDQWPEWQRRAADAVLSPHRHRLRPEAAPGETLRRLEEAAERRAQDLLAGEGDYELFALEVARILADYDRGR